MGVKGIMMLLFLVCGFFGSAKAQLIDQYNRYQTAWSKTKLHLSFNQYKFTPGDTAYFNAYYLDEKLHGVKGKQLINIHLVDPNGVSVVHNKFNVNYGTGFNQLVIPDSLSAGNYSIVAYSNWMRNFDQKFFFQRTVSVVNKHSLISDAIKPIKVFSEGGHFVSGVPNKIMLHTHQPEVEVLLYEKEGQGSWAGKTADNGTIAFIITPDKNKSYILEVNGTEVAATWPEVERDGLALRLHNNIGSDALGVEIMTPETSLIKLDEHRMLVTSQGQIFKNIELKKKGSDKVELMIPTENLPTGIAHLAILDSNGKVLSSRNFYHQNTTDQTIKVNVTASKTSYNTRDEVELDISLLNQQGENLNGKFSLLALNSFKSDSQPVNALEDEIRIFSEIEDHFIIDRSSENWLQRLNDYLIALESSTPWDAILSSKDLPLPLFKPVSTIQKRGIAYLNDSTGVTVPDFSRIVFYLQKDKTYYQSFTSNEGQFVIAIPDIFENDELFYLAKTQSGQQIPGVKIVWKKDEQIHFTLPNSAVESEDIDAYGAFMINKRLIDKSFALNKKVNYTDRKPEETVLSQFEKEIVEADVVVDVTSYKTFTTMQELVKEIVPSVRLRLRKGRNSVRIPLKEPAQNNPVYVIDDVMTKNTEFFLSLKPADLRYLKVVKHSKKLAPLGLIGENGIIIVQTKKGNSREPVDYSNVIEAVNWPLDHKSVNNVSNDGTAPKFESTVYWNPSINTSSEEGIKVSFYSTDDTVKLKLRLEGVTSDGIPFSWNGYVPIQILQEN